MRNVRQDVRKAVNAFHRIVKGCLASWTGHHPWQRNSKGCLSRIIIGNTLGRHPLARPWHSAFTTVTVCAMRELMTSLSLHHAPAQDWLYIASHSKRLIPRRLLAPCTQVHKPTTSQELIVVGSHEAIVSLSNLQDTRRRGPAQDPRSVAQARYSYIYLVVLRSRCQDARFPRRAVPFCGTSPDLCCAADKIMFYMAGRIFEYSF
jgi:hypothetical protein